MSILRGIGKLITGDVFGSVKDLLEKYLPPDLSPEIKAQIQTRLAELEHEKTLAIDASMTDRFKAELADVQDARLRHANSSMPMVITIIASAMLCALAYGLFFSGIVITDPVQNLALPLLGSVATIWTNAMGYWIGSSRSSQTKDFLIHSNK